MTELHFQYNQHKHIMMPSVLPFSKLNKIFFWIHWSLFFQIMLTTNFRGELTDISAKKEALDAIRCTKTCGHSRISAFLCAVLQPFVAQKKWSRSHNCVLAYCIAAICRTKKCGQSCNTACLYRRTSTYWIVQGEKWVSTGALRALDDPPVVQTNIWKSDWVPVYNTLHL